MQNSCTLSKHFKPDDPLEVLLGFMGVVTPGDKGTATAASYRVPEAKNLALFVYLLHCFYQAPPLRDQEPLLHSNEKLFLDIVLKTMENFWMPCTD
ncbi:hypothetical protein L1987_85529 [Smallanthus sonchifolius]|uniref:Uncharacterized protein n=1 Tax=Smallanthus sonchifolius TaxID=185202 RepID=A0ACB8XXH4_9ASTR|nr:hypothetical protein L1987_85529 [Smallanthus sonchifolius]